MSDDSRALVEQTLSLAKRHGLDLSPELTFNEQGLDFRIGFAKDASGRRWILRVPRRSDVAPKIEHEAKILDLVRRRLPVQVPNWQIRSPDLVAYPMLTDPTALTFDAKTYAVTWNIDPKAEIYVDSLAELLVALHATPHAEARAAGIPIHSPKAFRQKILTDLERVQSEIGIGAAKEKEWREWIEDDALWPDFAVLVHGDLYAGHVTANASSKISGVIDWTEAEVSDPSIDFTGHLAAFDVASLERLVAKYQRAGGRTWPNMVVHIQARYAASALKYAIFALVSGSQDHLAAAKVQLGLEG